MILVLRGGILDIWIELYVSWLPGEKGFTGGSKYPYSDGMISQLELCAQSHPATVVQLKIKTQPVLSCPLDQLIAFKADLANDDMLVLHFSAYRIGSSGKEGPGVLWF